MGENEKAGAIIFPLFQRVSSGFISLFDLSGFMPYSLPAYLDRCPGFFYSVLLIIA